MKKILGLGLIVVFTCCYFSCEESATDKLKRSGKSPQKSTKNFSLTSPAGFPQKPVGSIIPITLKNNTGVQTDSVLYYINNELIHKSTDIQSYQWDTKSNRLGKSYIRVEAWAEGKKEVNSKSLILLSDKAQELIPYTLLNTYPHDKKAYTQGLEYRDGVLYESTGTYGESDLRTVDLKSGEVIKLHKLNDERFGEGLTLIDDKIIQLTWRSREGYVYDKNSFELLKTFQYQKSDEGWGLCYDGKQLLKSDGSEKIYFLDPNNFTEVGHIEVYNHQGAIKNLNELEYVDGYLYANVYGADQIIKIDPATGKLLQVIDLRGILKDEDKHPDIDVLNGIAYNHDKKTWYITGKHWPKLFEISF